MEMSSENLSFRAAGPCRGGIAPPLRIPVCQESKSAWRKCYRIVNNGKLSPIMYYWINIAQVTEPPVPPPTVTAALVVRPAGTVKVAVVVVNVADTTKPLTRTYPLVVGRFVPVRVTDSPGTAVAGDWLVITGAVVGAVPTVVLAEAAVVLELMVPDEVYLFTTITYCTPVTKLGVTNVIPVSDQVR